jgi:hypothetical protein
MAWGRGGKSEANLGRAWALKLGLLVRAEEVDRGLCQQSASLRHHAIVHGRTDQLACSARKRQLRDRECPTRHIRESLACLRMVSLLQ